MDASKHTTVSAEKLKTWCENKLLQAGVLPEQAKVTADVLVHANVRGVDSHGVMRMEHYLNKLRAGGINPAANVRVYPRLAATAIVDGDDGLGHYVAKVAMDAAVDIARTQGIGAVGAMNSSHCGALSYFVRQAAERGMIGIAMTHTDKMVVPYGGTKAYFGTNPIAFGVPAGGKAPIILDMATSSVAYGKILEAKRRRTPIPADWAVDSRGAPITDPSEFAALLPFGGAKGSGLAMMIDIFSGILTGSPYGADIVPMYHPDAGVKRKLGHFFMAVDPGGFTDAARFLFHASRMVDEIRDIPAAVPGQPVLVPGDIEHRREQVHLQEGLTLPEDLYNFLNPA